MAGRVEFNDYTAAVKDAMKENAITFLEEASFELEAETKRTTPTKEPQLKGSWDHQVDEGRLEATVGSPLESALWNEFGTGSYAENGKGRKGWWVYVEGMPKSGRVSKTYATQKDAEKTVAMLRAQGYPAFSSNGKPKQKTLYNAFQRKKAAIIARAKHIFGGDG